MEDVRDFKGHIACDGDTRSEIVVPILVNGKVCNVPRYACSFRWGVAGFRRKVSIKHLDACARARKLGLYVLMLALGRCRS